MSKMILLVLAALPIGFASDEVFTLQVGDEAKATPSMLAAEYAKKLPSVGALVPKGTLREHIRRDLIPRLLATEDDRAAYQLGQNIFEKLASRSGSLIELGKSVSNGNLMNSEQIQDIMNSHKEISEDLHLMAAKIKGDIKESDVSNTVLQLMANSAKGFFCAMKATDRALALQGQENQKSLLHQHPCKMPFPGSLVMLGQTVSTPSELEIILPAEGDSMRLKPLEWMSEHLRRKLWCPDSFSRVGFGRDSVCEAVSSALDVPQHGELSMERAMFAQLNEAVQEGAELPKATAQSEAMSSVIEKDTKKDPMSLIQKQIEENTKRFEELHSKELELGKKLSLQAKKQRLQVLKERLAANKAQLQNL